MTTGFSKATLAGTGFAFVVAIALGWNLAAPEAAVSKGSSEKPQGERATKSSRSPKSVARDLAGARLAAIRGEKGPEARMRATIDLANSIHPSEFADWMGGGWFTIRGGAELTLFTKIVQERWMKEDPEGLLAFSLRQKTPLAKSVIGDWAQTDPDRLLRFFSEHRNDDMELMALNMIAGHHPELVLSRLAGIPFTQSGEGYGDMVRMLATLAQSSSSKLETLLDSLPSGLRAKAEVALSRERLKASFSEEMRRLWEQPEGLKTFRESIIGVKNAADQILPDIGEMPDEWKFAIGNDPFNFVQTSNAIEWLDLDLEELGFSENARRRIEQQALSRLMQENFEEAARRLQVSGLTEDQKQSLILDLALRAPDVARKYFGELPVEDKGQEASEPPEEEKEPVVVKTTGDWLKAIGTMSGNESIPYEMREMMQSWDASQISRLTVEFKRLPAEVKQRVADIYLNSASYEQANEFGGEAIRYLLENPGDGNPGRPGQVGEWAANHAVFLSTKNPEAAAAWVKSLPPGEARWWAMKNLGRNWKQYDPYAANRWEASLSADERAAVEKLGK